MTRDGRSPFDLRLPRKTDHRAAKVDPLHALAQDFGMGLRCRSHAKAVEDTPSRIAVRPDDCGEVGDRGIGISDDEIRHVTTRFFRGRRGDLAGSGLGLAIVDRIVHDHHGFLSFRSAVGVGTTVTVTVPMASA